ncbi:GNAT family N-acetyltransferase (plasmid) [Streptomyces sp. BI20]|uniref:GNAT family N-acetyltransferase n=1 Tax=Streptomyces sp. BI20 TaxID=3403460 RepID=UPI003C70AC7A
MSRGAARPVEVPWGLRIDLAGPERAVRHVLFDPEPEAARALIDTLTDPGTCVKAFLSPEAMEPWFPAVDWEPAEPCFLMATALRPIPVRAPDGYRTEVERAGGLVRVRVVGPGGDPAAYGQAGLTDTACVFDQIVTEPAHRRRGLGTVVMGALTGAAVDAGVTEGVLGATVQGRALYETLGWRGLAPLSGFTRRPVGR